MRKPRVGASPDPPCTRCSPRTTSTPRAGWSWRTPRRSARGRGGGLRRATAAEADRLGYLFRVVVPPREEEPPSFERERRNRDASRYAEIRFQGRARGFRGELHQPPLRFVRGRRPRHRPGGGAPRVAVSRLVGARHFGKSKSAPHRLPGRSRPRKSRVPGGRAGRLPGLSPPGTNPGTLFLPPLLHLARLGGDRECAPGHGGAPAARISRRPRRCASPTARTPWCTCCARGVRECGRVRELRGRGRRRLARRARRAVPPRDGDRRRASAARPRGSRVRVPPGRRRAPRVPRRVPRNVLAPYNTFYETLEADLETAGLSVDALSVDAWRDPQCALASGRRPAGDASPNRGDAAAASPRPGDASPAVERMSPEAFAPFIVPFRGDTFSTKTTRANPFAVPETYVAALDAESTRGGGAARRAERRAAGRREKTRPASHHPGALQGVAVRERVHAAGVRAREDRKGRERVVMVFYSTDVLQY